MEHNGTEKHKTIHNDTEIKVKKRLKRYKNEIRETIANKIHVHSRL